MPLYWLYSAQLFPSWSGILHRAREQPEVILAILHFTPGRVQLPTQAEVEREVRRNVPVVLEEGAENVGALAPGAAVHAAADLRKPVPSRKSASPAPLPAPAVASGSGPAVYRPSNVNVPASPLLPE